jgi:hypothetical protein
VQFGFHYKFGFNWPYLKSDALIYYAVFTPRPLQNQIKNGTGQKLHLTSNRGAATRPEHFDRGLAADQDWLHKATKEIAKFWRNKRRRRFDSSANPPARHRHQAQIRI